MPKEVRLSSLGRCRVRGFTGNVVGMLWTFDFRGVSATGANEASDRLGICLPYRKVLPDFTLEDPSGTPVTWDFAARSVKQPGLPIRPCRAEMPAMEQLYQNFGDKGWCWLLSAGRAEQVSAFGKELHLLSPSLDSKGVASAYGVRGLPSTYLIDRQGISSGRSSAGGSGIARTPRLFSSTAHPIDGCLRCLAGRQGCLRFERQLWCTTIPTRGRDVASIAI
jgi:hypothetical protein